VASAQEIGALWTASCMDGDYAFAPHELPWFVYSMSAAQCHNLITDAPGLTDSDRDRLAATCDRILD
jgi:hypothetical protein